MIRSLLLLLLSLSAAPALGQYAVVIYRCTDASGAVSMQNDEPCPKGTQEQRRVMETDRPSVRPTSPIVSPPPASEPLVSLVRVAAALDDGGDEDATRSDDGTSPAEPDAVDDAPDTAPADPPPPLFSCRTWDRKEYFSDDPVPARRCAPLRVTGLDGSAGGGNTSACETVTDTCEPVPDEALCEQWHKHEHDTRALLLFNRADDPVATRVELERIETAIQASACKPDR